MRLFFALYLIIPFLWSCSFYRSEGRKQFESAFPISMKAAAIEPNECHQSSQLETLFTEEFPSSQYELILADSNLEIWMTQSLDFIEIKTLQSKINSTHICTYTFLSEEHWNLMKNHFIESLKSESNETN